ncbi:alpha/beta hydrolase family protein [Candidatus Palauibacter sp.]|uniref:alpha/beta hydrolase family protein n=1 Tax=Candidatus Palauibacter sp. TaxID=3101350 RepID=UPI003AF25B61
MEDVVAGADYLRALPEVDPERIGITGNELRWRDEHVRGGLRPRCVPRRDPRFRLCRLGPLLSRGE